MRSAAAREVGRVGHQPELVVRARLGAFKVRDAKEHLAGGGDVCDRAQVAGGGVSATALPTVRQMPASRYRLRANEAPLRRRDCDRAPERRLRRTSDASVMLAFRTFVGAGVVLANEAGRGAGVV
jgi:hypothetical protein